MLSVDPILDLMFFRSGAGALVGRGCFGAGATVGFGGVRGIGATLLASEAAVVFRASVLGARVMLDDGVPGLFTPRGVLGELGVVPLLLIEVVEVVFGRPVSPRGDFADKDFLISPDFGSVLIDVGLLGVESVVLFGVDPVVVAAFCRDVVLLLTDVLLAVLVTAADCGLDEEGFIVPLASVAFGFTSLVFAEEDRARLGGSRLEVVAAVRVVVLGFLLGLGAAAAGRLREAEGCGLVLAVKVFVVSVPTFPFVSGVAGCSLETAAVSVLVRTPVTASLGLASSGRGPLSRCP